MGSPLVNSQIYHAVFLSRPGPLVDVETASLLDVDNK
jgi:hypothetical protein